MTLQFLINSIILSLTLATVILTITTFIIHQFRRIPKYSKPQKIYNLESIYFKRYAPQLDISLQNQIQEQKADRKLNIFKKVSFIYVFGIVFMVICSVIIINYLSTFKNNSKISWSQRQDTFRFLQTQLSENENLYIFKTYSYRNLNIVTPELKNESNFDSFYFRLNDRIVKNKYIFSINKNIWPENSDMGLFLAFANHAHNTINFNDFKFLNWNINQYVISESNENAEFETNILDKFNRNKNIINSVGMYFDRKTNTDIVVQNTENKSNFYEFQKRRIQLEQVLLKPIQFFLNWHGNITNELLVNTILNEIPLLITDFSYFNEIPLNNYIFLKKHNLLLLNLGLSNTEKILLDSSVTDPDKFEEKLAYDLNSNLIKNDLHVLLLDPEKIGINTTKQILTKLQSRFTDKKIFTFNATNLFEWEKMKSKTEVDIDQNGTLSVSNVSEKKYENVPVSFNLIPTNKNNPIGQSSNNDFNENYKNENTVNIKDSTAEKKPYRSLANELGSNHEFEKSAIQKRIKWIKKDFATGQFLFLIDHLESNEKIQFNIFDLYK